MDKLSNHSTLLLVFFTSILLRLGSLFYPSRLSWHIITARSVVHIISPSGCISSRVSVHFPCGLMIYRNKLRMICNSFGIDDIQGFALICFQKSDIVYLINKNFTEYRYGYYKSKNN